MLPSISIATSNGANFLLDQLNSLAEQTYLPDALWITDDGSTDVTQVIIALYRSQIDLANLDQVRDVSRSVKPDLIINPAAYTAVDKAESEPELAMRINGEAPGVMAEEAKNLGAAMIHYSTDYLFDGSKSAPYDETDPTCPINVYGATKLAGEQAIQAEGIPHLILCQLSIWNARPQFPAHHPAVGARARRITHHS